MKNRLVPVGVTMLLAGVARTQALAITPGAQTEAAATLYAARYATCHGDALTGGDHGSRMKDAGFWEQWQNAPARRLYSRILSTMPMNDPGSLSPAETLALVTLIARENGRPLPHRPIA